MVMLYSTSGGGNTKEAEMFVKHGLIFDDLPFTILTKSSMSFSITNLTNTTGVYLDCSTGGMSFSPLPIKKMI